MRPSAKLLVWTDADRAALETLVERNAPPISGRDDTVPRFLPKVPDLIERARTLIAQRRTRRPAFGDDARLFHEPAWDILLELYVVPARRPVPVSSMAYAIDVPISTTLRWFTKLQEHGLVESLADPIDARIRRISLSQKAIDMMESYLKGV
jgi:DNA-binding MarR family transcriptional regulator